MTAIVTDRRRGLFLALVAAIYAAEILALRVAPGLTLHPDIAGWVPIIDLILLPLLLYGLVFGWKQLARAGGGDPTPALLLALGMLAARTAVPATFRPSGGLLAALLVCGELVLAALLIRRGQRIVQTFRERRVAGAGFYEAARDGFAAVLPATVAKVLTLEFAMVSTLAGYRWIRRAEGGGQLFPYASRGSTGPAYLTLGLLAAAEAVGLHIVLVRWLPPAWHPAVWALTILGLYGLIWLLGDFLAMRARPHRIVGDQLALRLGARWAVQTQLENVASAAAYHPKRGPWVDAVLCPRLTEPNVAITFHEPVTLASLLGRTHVIRSLAIAADAPERFMQALRGASPQT